MNGFLQYSMERIRVDYWSRVSERTHSKERVKKNGNEKKKRADRWEKEIETIKLPETLAVRTLYIHI